MKFTPFVRLSCGTLLLTGLLVSTPAISIASATEVLTAQAQPQAHRLRIAVLDFEFATTGLTGTVLNFLGSASPAQGVSNLLTNRLVQDGSYTVIERSRIEAVLREQGLAQVGVLDPTTAAQVGRILGADAIVLGSVTRFNLEQGRSGGGIFGIGGTSSRTSAEVQLTARLVNTTTAEIMAVAEGSGTDRQNGGGFSLGGMIRFGSETNNVDELLSNAAEAAVSQITTRLAAEASRLAALPPALPTVEALVADVAGTQIILNKGSFEGFRAGMTISIERVSRQVTDPATGAVLRTIASPIGRIELTDVDENSSVGRVTTGTGFRVGDRAIAVE